MNSLTVPFSSLVIIIIAIGGAVQVYSEPEVFISHKEDWLEVEGGKSFSITCEVSVFAYNVSVIWEYDGKEIEDNAVWSPYFAERGLLSVPFASLDIKGNYSCFARSNSWVTDRKYIFVNVTGPAFINSFMRVETVFPELQYAILTCMVKYAPVKNFTLTWSRKGNPLVSNHKDCLKLNITNVEQVTIPQNSTCFEQMDNSLIIVNPKTIDSGLYRCTVNLGDRLLIKQTRLLSGVTAMFFQDLPSNIMRAVGDLVNINCEVFALLPNSVDVSYTFTWKFNGSMLPTPPGANSLHLANVRLNQSGVYECFVDVEANNFSTTLNRSTNLQVTGWPPIPVFSKVKNTNSSTFSFLITRPLVRGSEHYCVLVTANLSAHVNYTAAKPQKSFFITTRPLIELPIPADGFAYVIEVWVKSAVGRGRSLVVNMPRVLPTVTDAAKQNISLGKAYAAMHYGWSMQEMLGIVFFVFLGFGIVTVVAILITMVIRKHFRWQSVRGQPVNEPQALFRVREGAEPNCEITRLSTDSSSQSVFSALRLQQDSSSSPEDQVDSQPALFSNMLPSIHVPVAPTTALHRAPSSEQQTPMQQGPAGFQQVPSSSQQIPPAVQHVPNFLGGDAPAIMQPSLDLLQQEPRPGTSREGERRTPGMFLNPADSRATVLNRRLQEMAASWRDDFGYQAAAGLAVDQDVDLMGSPTPGTSTQHSNPFSARLQARPAELQARAQNLETAGDTAPSSNLGGWSHPSMAPERLPELEGFYFGYCDRHDDRPQLPQAAGRGMLGAAFAGATNRGSHGAALGGAAPQQGAGRASRINGRRAMSRGRVQRGDWFLFPLDAAAAGGAAAAAAAGGMNPQSDQQPADQQHAETANQPSNPAVDIVPGPRNDDDNVGGGFNAGYFNPAYEGHH